MITCSVCGCLNDPTNIICEECGSDLVDESELEKLTNLHYLAILTTTIK